MDLRSLRYFAEIAATGTFSGAAARLHRSQPALSRAIRELESELGVRLFERVGRNVTLSAAGRALLERARVVLDEVDALAEQARLLAAGKTRILRVGAVPNLVEVVLPELLRRYRARWPEVEVSLQPEGGPSLLLALERGEVDIAIARYAQSASFEAQPAFPFYVLAVVSRTHRLAGMKAVGIRDLAGERLLIAPPSITSRRLFDAACQQVGVRPRIGLESLEFNALIALAQADQGVAVVPSMVSTERHAVSVSPILHKGKALGSWTALVWDRRREQSDYAKDFVRQACAYLRTHYPGRELNVPVPARRPEQIGGDSL